MVCDGFNVETELAVAAVAECEHLTLLGDHGSVVFTATDLQTFIKNKKSFL